MTIKSTISKFSWALIFVFLGSAGALNAQNQPDRRFILPEAKTPRTLTLKEALKLATRQNWQQKIVLAQSQQQETVVPKAWSSLLPQIQGNANYNQNYPEQTVSFQNQDQIEAQATLYESIGGLMLQASELESDEALRAENEQNAQDLIDYSNQIRQTAAEPVIVQPSNFLSAQVNVVLPLFDARAFPLLQNAYTSVQLNQLANQDVKTKILYNVVIAYWNAVLAKGQFDLATESLKRAQTLSQMAIKKVELGAAPSLEKERALLQVLSAQKGVTQTAYNRELAIGYLGLLIGAPVAFDVIAPPSAPTNTQDIQYYLQQAKTNRLDLQIQNHQITMAQREVRASYYSFIPRLQAIGRGSYTDNTRGFTREPYSAAVIFQATIPIFEGGARFATLKEKQAKAREAHLQKGKMNAEIDAEVRSSLKALANEKAALLIQEKTVEVAEKAFSQSQTLYEVGKIAQNEVIISLEDLKQAQQALQASRLQLQIGYYALYLSTGSFLQYLEEVQLWNRD